MRVSPGARRDGIVGRYGEAWRIRVSAPPERGRANEGVLRILARALALPRDGVRLVAGHGARDKIVELDGIEAPELERRLLAAGRKEV